MITYNDISLDQIAPVKIEDIRVSPISYNATARQRPVGFGSDFVRMTGGGRTVSITFALLTQDITTRQNQLMQITSWAWSDTPGKLQMDGYPGRHLDAICTAFPEPSTRQWWESKLRLVFTTFDNPFWTSDYEHTVACGTEFVALGEAPPLITITRTLTGAATNQAYSDGTNTMTFSTIPAGDLVIDLNRQTAAVGGTSIMSGYSFASSFIRPKPGRQTITGTGTIHWRERWF